MNSSPEKKLISIHFLHYKSSTQVHPHVLTRCRQIIGTESVELLINLISIRSLMAIGQRSEMSADCVSSRPLVGKNT